MDKIALLHAKIYAEHETIQKGYLTIQNGKIEAISRVDESQSFNDYKRIELPPSFKVIPGRIDMHIHGANGADVMDATHVALSTMAQTLPKEGTTSFLATTITQSPHAIENALRNVASYKKHATENGVADVIGIHLEGPFLNKKKAGAQPREHLQSPSVEQFKKWQTLAGGLIKVVTLAPELPGGEELIHYLKQHGAIASIGHTNATYSDVVDAVKAGATQMTHLFNGMRGIHHRDPGAPGAAFMLKGVKVELIADGIHVHPEILNLTYQLKGANDLLLITDAMRAKFLKNGTYDLGGQKVTVENGKATLKDGTLAGSVLSMNEAVMNMKKFTNCTLEETIIMTSVNPAKQLGLYDKIGSLTTGKDADIVILDEQFDIYMTICKGKIAYRKNE